MFKRDNMEEVDVVVGRFSLPQRVSVILPLSDNPDFPDLLLLLPQAQT